MKKDEFEKLLIREDVVEYFLSKSKEEIEKMLGNKVARMVGFEQKNSHHCYDLWEHTLRTVEGIKPDNLTPEQFKKLRVAAFFHDIGKPDVSAFNEKTGQQTFYGHAKRSREISEKILKEMGYSYEEACKIGFFIGHHDDFISYKSKLAPWMETHEYIRGITPETVAEKVFESKYKFDEYISYDKDQVRFICYTLAHNGKQPTFTNINGPINIKVDMDLVEENVKFEKIFSGAHYIDEPNEEDFNLLLELCKADAGAQSEVVMQNGKRISSKEEKIENLTRIQQNIPEAYKIEEKWENKLYMQKKDLDAKLKSKFMKFLININRDKKLSKKTIDISENMELYNVLFDMRLTFAMPENEFMNVRKINNKYVLEYGGCGEDWDGYRQVGSFYASEIDKQQLQKTEQILKKLEETKTVVTHFGDDLDNKSAVYALERFAIENGALNEGEHLTVERVPAGKVKEGLLNVDTGGHKGSRFDENTLVIDGNPSEGVKSASAELASLGIYVPEQIVELADIISNKVSPLESRTALSLVRNVNGKQVFEIAEAGLLDSVLTDKQLEKYGLVEAQKKQQGIIDNAVEKVNKYSKELVTGEKVVIAPEQILGGAQIAYELGANYYASVQAHKSGKGSTFAVTSKPGVQLPEEIKKFGQELVEKYKNPTDGTSGVFLNPNGQMLVAGGMKNPDFSVDYTPEEIIGELSDKFERYASRNNKNYTSEQIIEGISPREGEIEEVLKETARLAEKEDKENKKEGFTQK